MKLTVLFICAAFTSASASPASIAGKRAALLAQLAALDAIEPAAPAEVTRAQTQTQIGAVFRRTFPAEFVPASYTEGLRCAAGKQHAEVASAATATTATATAPAAAAVAATTIQGSYTEGLRCVAGAPTNHPPAVEKAPTRPVILSPTKDTLKERRLRLAAAKTVAAAATKTAAAAAAKTTAKTVATAVIKGSFAEGLKCVAGAPAPVVAVKQQQRVPMVSPPSVGGGLEARRRRLVEAKKKAEAEAADLAVEFETAMMTTKVKAIVTATATATKKDTAMMDDKQRTPTTRKAATATKKDTVMVDDKKRTTMTRKVAQAGAAKKVMMVEAAPKVVADETPKKEKTVSIATMKRAEMRLKQQQNLESVRQKQAKQLKLADSKKEHLDFVASKKRVARKAQRDASIARAKVKASQMAAAATAASESAATATATSHSAARQQLSNSKRMQQVVEHANNGPFSRSKSSRSMPEARPAGGSQLLQIAAAVGLISALGAGALYAFALNKKGKQQRRVSTFGFGSVTPPTSSGAAAFIPFAAARRRRCSNSFAMPL